jgi:peptidoglycan hydrolase-like protein with peptidoglycan-binding domain
MTLSIGSVGPQVRQLQGSLNMLPTKLPPLAIDGIFGTRTDARVREFQGLNFLAVDGIVGILTLAALELALSLLKKVVPPVSGITVTQKNAATLTAAHDASTPVVLPAVTFRFSELPANARIHEFLFENSQIGIGVLDGSGGAGKHGGLHPGPSVLPPDCTAGWSCRWGR